MAANIESQVRAKLSEFESLVTAAHSAACATTEPIIGAAGSGTYAVWYLTERVTIEFEELFNLLVREVLPLVADIKRLGGSS